MGIVKMRNYIIFNEKRHNWQLCMLKPKFRKRFDMWNEQTKGVQLFGLAFSYWPSTSPIKENQS